MSQMAVLAHGCRFNNTYKYKYKYKYMMLTVIESIDTAVLQPAPTSHPVYLDVEPADTAHYLNIVRALNISTYRLSYERSSADRLRIGAIGPRVAEIMPDAVELVPRRVLPPIEKGGEPVVLLNIPVVNENTLFMYGVGATQELIHKVDALSVSLSGQVEQVMALFGETAKLEHLLSQSSDGEAELRIRASMAEAEIANSQMEIEMQRAQDEEAYLVLQKQAEIAQIKRNEELTLARLVQEEETARNRAKVELKLKFEGNRKIELSRSNAAEALSIMQYERDVALQRASEEMKVRTAKVRLTYYEYLTNICVTYDLFTN